MGELIVLSKVKRKLLIDEIKKDAPGITTLIKRLDEYADDQIEEMKKEITRHKEKFPNQT